MYQVILKQSWCRIIKNLTYLVISDQIFTTIYYFQTSTLMI